MIDELTAVLSLALLLSVLGNIWLFFSLGAANDQLDGARLHIHRLEDHVQYFRLYALPGRRASETPPREPPSKSSYQKWLLEQRLNDTHQEGKDD